MSPESPPGGAPAVKACMEPPGDSANVCKMALEWKRYETIKRGIWIWVAFGKSWKITISLFLPLNLGSCHGSYKAHPWQFDKQIGSQDLAQNERFSLKNFGESSRLTNSLRKDSAMTSSNVMLAIFTGP